MSDYNQKVERLAIAFYERFKSGYGDIPWEKINGSDKGWYQREIRYLLDIVTENVDDVPESILLKLRERVMDNTTETPAEFLGTYDTRKFMVIAIDDCDVPVSINKADYKRMISSTYWHMFPDYMRTVLRTFDTWYGKSAGETVTRFCDRAFAFAVRNFELTYEDLFHQFYDPALQNTDDAYERAMAIIATRNTDG